MRVINIFSFETANKVKFSELPAIVHRFLDEQGLCSGRFLYYLESFDYKELAQRQKAMLGFMDKFQREDFDKQIEKYLKYPWGSPCARAVKDCPKLGPVRSLTPPEKNDLKTLYVSNILDPTDCTEADVAPFYKRIERTYGIGEADLFYCDIDFFGKTIPAVRDTEHIKGIYERYGSEYDESYKLPEQLIGSYIKIDRCNAGIPRWNVLEMSIDILHDGIIMDAKPYREAMAELLPGVKCSSSLAVILSEEEKAAVADAGKKAEPMIRKCRSFLKKRLHGADHQILEMPNYKIAPKLRKLSREHGYDYTFVLNGVFSMKKRLPRGHFLVISTTSGPSHADSTFGLTFTGLGFSHSLGCAMYAPSCQEEFDACAEDFFAAAAEFEKTYAMQLNELYDVTPEWFFPND